MTRYSSLLMIALGVFAILVNTTVAVVIIALGVAMFFFERILVRKAQQPGDVTS